MVRILNLFRCVLPCFGLFIAGTLWIASALGASVPCGTQEFCSRVLTSKLSSIGGIPMAAFGTLLYAILILSAVMTTAAPSEQGSQRWFSAGYIGYALGAIGSLCLTAYSVFSLHTTCSWCLASAIVMASTFGIHGWIAATPKPSKVFRRIEALPVLALGAVVSLVALGFFGVRLKADAFDQGIDLTSLTRMNPAELIPPTAHSWGAKNAIYDLVFFGDLECPTCHVWFSRAREIVLRTRGRFVYRHCPLSIHSLAATAAIVCEEASVHGKFAEAVEEAYSRDFDANSLAKLIEHYGDRSSEALAHNRLAVDEAVDTKLNITKTPTMVLVFSDGRREPINLAELDRRSRLAAHL